MDEEVLTELLSIRKDFLEVVSSASESYTLKEKLEILVAISKTGDGRADLASKNHLYNQQVILISK
jgi:ataxin-10